MVIFIDRRLFVLYNNKNGVGEDAIAKIPEAVSRILQQIRS